MSDGQFLHALGYFCGAADSPVVWLTLDDGVGIMLGRTNRRRTYETISPAP
jgi:hypothetical protein